MSVDLDLELRLPTVKLAPRNSDKIDTDSESCVSEDEYCRTPRSNEDMIPAVIECPAAPRKPRRRSSCKRKLYEVENFEIVAEDEIEIFFRRVEENIAIKRRLF